MTNKDVKFIELPKIPDHRGNLSFFENSNQIPFTISRVYWIYDVPGGGKREGHAYKEIYEFIIALSGSFDVVVHDGKEERKYNLNRSYKGLYIPAMMWRSLENFSTNALAFIASDSVYNDEQYIKDFNQFTKMANAQKKQHI